MIIHLYGSIFIIKYDIILLTGNIYELKSALEKELKQNFSEDTMNNDYILLILNNQNNFSIRYEKYFGNINNKWKSTSPNEYVLDIKMVDDARDIKLMLNCLEKYRTSTEKMTEDMIKAQQCLICFNGSKNIILTPCNHIYCCSVCAPRKNEDCHMCRKKISSAQKVFIN